MIGTNGNDNLVGGPGNDTLMGLGGNDRLRGLGGNDLLNGGTGIDTMDGGFGNDTYVVDNVLDIAAEVAGGVDLVLSSVSYTLSTNLENLTLTGALAINGTGNAKNNTIIGNGANNVLSGLDGNDRIIGGLGNDAIVGGNGNDRIVGGNGTDTLTGGTANDTFDFNSVLESQPGVLRDVINDFVGNGILVGDRIDLSTIDANINLGNPGNQAFTFIGAAAFTAPGQVRYAGGIIRANTGGSLAPELEIRLIGAPLLVATDFIL